MRTHFARGSYHRIPASLATRPASVGILIKKATTFDGSRYWYLGFYFASAGGLRRTFRTAPTSPTLFRIAVADGPGRPQFIARRFHTPIENAIYLGGTSATRPSGIESGEHHRQPRRRGSRCTRALMRTLGRSRWLELSSDLCRCLHSGCTDGAGPWPSIEP